MTMILGNSIVLSIQFYVYEYPYIMELFLLLIHYSIM